MKKYIKSISGINNKKASCRCHIFWSNSLSLFLSWGISVILSSCYKEKTFPVTTEFSIEVVDNDYSVPVKVKVINNTAGAETYNWIMLGADITNSDKKDPGTIEYTTPGTYKIILEAANQYGGKGKKEMEVRIDAPIKVNFTFTNTAYNYPPVACQLTNTTTDATWYEWTFEGGTPATSTLKDPGSVIFNTPGNHKISLKTGNDRVSYTKDTTITVLPDLVNDFQITWATEDNDMEAPFTAVMQNNCVSATSYSWSFQGGTPSVSTNAAPTVVYNTPGTYTISLTASNDKKTLTTTKTITVKSNSNLFQFKDVHLGINTAQNTIGSYFSSILGRVLKSNEVTAINGNKIDFAYFGLNNTFSYNKFLSPDSVQNFTFAAIPNAIPTKLINKQEACSCGSSMTATQFDAMSNDAVLRSMTINETGAGLTQFDNTTIPRVILFQTRDGRKGAIKIKQFVDMGQQSYVVCDIKVMKQ